MGFLKRRKEIRKIEPKLSKNVELKEGEEIVEEQPEEEIVKDEVETEEEIVEEQPKEKVVEEDENIWSVQEIPTQTQPIIYNKETKKTYDLYSAVVEILNRIEEEVK